MSFYVSLLYLEESHLLLFMEVDIIFSVNGYITNNDNLLRLNYLLKHKKIKGKIIKK